MSSATSSSSASWSQFRREWEQLKKAIEPLQSISDLGKLSERLPTLDNARLNAIYAYAVNALIYMHLKVQGVRTVDHPIKEELERVKHYFEKISEVKKRTEREQGHSVSGLDKAASQRFIKHALAGNSTASASQSAASSTATSSTESSSARKTKTKKKAKKKTKKSSNEKGEKGEGNAQAASSPSSDEDTQSETTEGPMTGKKRLRATSTTLGSSMVSKSLSSSKRSTPEPKLTHLNWKEELKKKSKKH
eukprot:gb/GECG01006412.1/.p1 GENE.gb/GECG01006412.1/~~gb/GECG01006412.1/.p1  ORF type:complete len:249 (+),score=51.47 gb/GECG01006412.1/:1-747(+)